MGIGREPVVTSLALAMKKLEKREKLNGWTYVGSYESCHIYKKGEQRRLVNSKTGKSTFEYRVGSKSK